MFHLRFPAARLGGLALLAAACTATAGQAELALAEAERLALARDPLIGRFHSLAAANREQAVAEGQLPDPKLRLGALNFPTDSFNRSQEPMTQLLVGVSQSFPPGDTLALKRRQSEQGADLELAQAAERRLAVLRSTRRAWLDLYLQHRSAEVIAKSRGYFEQLRDVTEAHYASGRATQQDVLQAQLELTRLDDRHTLALEAADEARANLESWVGPDAERPVGAELAPLPAPGEAEALADALAQHPALQAENARISQRRTGSEIAREQYKPGWMLDVSYGNRSGDNPDGSGRADFMSAMVQLDLPLFRDKRQDRRLAASEQQVFAATQARDEKLRELRRMLDAGHAKWRRLGERQALYRERLVPDAESHARAALQAYQAGLSDFSRLMRARIGELDARLEALRLEVERAKVQAELLYLQGGEA
jgi:outer membrane protein TolC